MPVDVEALVSQFLRSRAEVIALVGDRVYTDLPHQRVYPLVLITRFGGGFIINRPLWLDEAALQLDCFGGTHRQSWNLMATCLELLHNKMLGQFDEGVVTGVITDNAFYNPQEDFFDERGHARPRFTANVTVLTHPVATSTL